MIIQVRVLKEMPLYIKGLEVENSIELWGLLAKHGIYSGHFQTIYKNDEEFNPTKIPPITIPLKEGDTITLVPKIKAMSKKDWEKSEKEKERKKKDTKMEIHFIVKSEKEIIGKEDFKNCIISKITNIIQDNYWLKDKQFNFEVLVEEVE